MTFTANGKIVIHRKDGTEVRAAVFEIEAENRDEAKFMFNHGAAEASLPRGWKVYRLDLRTLKSVIRKK